MEKKSRQTSQKELLNEEMNNFSSFFTAEELFIKVKNKDKKLGIATVYRFLNDLLIKRSIHKYSCDRKAIYSLDKKSHCHFICEKCGNKSHIDINSIDFIKNKISGDICHFQIDINGICEKCKKS